MVAAIRRDVMALGRELKRRAKAAIAPLVFLSITGYFGWSATQGNHGLVAYAQRQELLRQADADHAAAQADRDNWERRVAGLRANHLDPDTLDERVAGHAQSGQSQRRDRALYRQGPAVLTANSADRPAGGRPGVCRRAARVPYRLCCTATRRTPHAAD